MILQRPKNYDFINKNLLFNNNLNQVFNWKDIFIVSSICLGEDANSDSNIDYFIEIDDIN